MRPFPDGARLEPMIERSFRLTGEELHALADSYDEDRSRSLRAPVAGDLAHRMAWRMLPAEVDELCDVVTDAARRARLSSSEARRAWGVVADEMTIRLFPRLEPLGDRLGRPWRDILEGR